MRIKVSELNLTIPDLIGWLSRLHQHRIPVTLMYVSAFTRLPYLYISNRRFRDGYRNRPLHLAGEKIITTPHLYAVIRDRDVALAEILI